MKQLIATVAAGLVFALPLSCSAKGMDVHHDKAQHIGASYATEMFLAKNKPFCKWKKWQRVVFNVGVVGGSKELYDHKHPSSHSAEWGDIAADAVGAIGAEGTVWLLHKTW